MVSVTNDLATDQRVHKVCLYLTQRGYDVTLIGRLLPDSLPLNRPYRCKRFKLLFNAGPLFYAAYSFRLFCFLLFRKIDLLLSNDLDTLLPNYLIGKLKRKRVIYDSHEFFTGVPELMDRPRIRKIWERIERFTLPHIRDCYTVNEAIAAQYKSLYGNNFKVLRNVAPKWQAANLPSRAELGLPENQFILIFQGAGINMHRGAEEMLEAMCDLPDCCLLFAGSGDALPYLKKRCAELQLSNVLFFAKRPYPELMQLTANADLGLSLDRNTNPNYAFSLPNKLFDYFQAGIPVLTSDVQEVKRVVDTWQIGMTLKQITAQELVAAVREIRSDALRYQTWKANCKKAAGELNWEHEVQVLDDLFPVIT